MKRSILSTLLLFFVALGLTGTQVSAIMITPAEAAEQAAAEEREEQVSRKSRRPQTGGKKVQPPFVIPSLFIGSTWNATRTDLRSRFFLQSNLPPGNLRLLQVYRV
ncbi:MAG TPA: hypothetical protein VHM64_24595 [Candidatus Binatia bacterium]|nr:hypothetical protein [Candidatus Binatia bacterium]